MKISNILITLMLLNISAAVNAMVVGYTFDFSKADYIISGEVISRATLGNDLSLIDLYQIKIKKVIQARKTKAEEKFLWPINEDDSITFIYARHIGWIDTGYQAMVGKREKLDNGSTYDIPIKFDDKLAMYTIFDMYYDVIDKDKLLQDYIISPRE